MEPSYGTPDDYINAIGVAAYLDSSGITRISNKELASNNFDGFIPTTTSSITVSELNVGEAIGVEVDGEIAFYPILSIEREDPFLDSGSYTGAHIIYYLDENELKEISYSSSNTQVMVSKQDWANKELGLYGWYLSQEGNAIFTNVAVRGRIEATEGYIGNSESGWEIGPELLSNASVGMYAPSITTGEIAFFAGAPFESRASAVFRVGYDGQLNASSATISGNLTATTLDVGGANGIVYNGSTVTIGASVNILAPVTVNSLQVGASPTLLRIADNVNGTNDGIYINANNYWYSDGQFGVGGSANNVVWSGSTLAVTGDINATTITASNGTIAGFTLSNNQFSIPGITFSSSGGLRLGASSQFSVDQNGNMVATSASIAGNINATSGAFTGSVSAQHITASTGTIAGWGLSASILSGTNASIVSTGDIILGAGQNVVELSSSDTNFRLWAGSATPTNAPFRVTSTGGLVATSASITGDITAQSGRFTGSVVAQHITASTGSVGGWGLSASTLSGANATLNSASGSLVLGTGQNIAAMSSSDTNRIWAGSANSTTAPFRVTSAGGLVATSASIVGDINATSGSFTGALSAQSITASVGNVAGWSLSASVLTGNSASLSAAGSILLGSGQTIVALSATDSNRIWAGSANSSTAPFKVSNTGFLTATGASITGDITASSGRFVGGVTIDTGGFLRAGTGAQNVSIDSTGLYGYNNLGLLAVKIPTDGTDPIIGKFKILETGLVSQVSESGANIVVGEVIGSGSAASVQSGMVIRGYRTLNASVAIYTVQAGSATTYTEGNGIYFDETGKFKIKGATGSIRFDGDDLYISGNVNARSGQFTGSIVAQHITASTGSIGGWGLGLTSIFGNNATLNSASGSLVLGTGQNIAAMSATDTNRIWAGSANSATAPFRVDSSGGLVATTASITGNITANSGQFTGSVVAQHITASTSGIIGGFSLNSTSLSATNIVLSSSGGLRLGTSSQFSVDISGNMSATSASIIGDIRANSGSIAGWTLNSGLLTGTNASIVSGGDIILGSGQNIVRLSSSDSNFRLWAGSATASVAPFRITTTGGLVATTASITGNIVANSGSFTGALSAQSITASVGLVGGFVLSSNSLTASNSTTSVVGLSTSASAFFAGATSRTGGGAQFWVSQTGSIFANAATIVGNITATNITSSVGNVGGFLLSASSLTASVSASTAVGISTGASAIFAGATSRAGGGARFWVSNTGSVFAVGANISGDSTINGTNIGNGGGNIASNLRVGSLALDSNTSGSFNIALGDGALRSNTVGSQNVALGSNALFTSTSANNNIAIGNQAMSSAGSQNSENIAIGRSVMTALGTAGRSVNNIGIGNSAHYYGESASNNVAIGTNALFNVNVGSRNVAIGTTAGSSIYNGVANVAIGDSALKANTDGSNNIAIGPNSTLNLNGGNNNVALGNGSLRDNQNGSRNVAIGFQALQTASAGSDNIAIGYRSGQNATGGNFNIFIGYDPGVISTSSNTYIGVGDNRLGLQIDNNRKVSLFGDLQVDTNVLYVDAGTNRVGILNAAPSFPLDISGNTRIDGSASIVGGGDLTIINGDLEVYNSSNNDFPFRVINGTSSATSEVRSRSIFDLHTANAANVRVVPASPYELRRFTSSQKIKEDIRPLSGTLINVDIEKISEAPARTDVNDVLLLSGAEFRSTATCDGEQIFLGFIAEDVAAKFPIAAEKDENGEPCNIIDRAIVAALLEVVKRQQEQIQQLSDKIDRLGEKK